MAKHSGIEQLQGSPLHDLWTCPNCGRQFAYENQWHSCRNYSLETYLTGKAEHQVRLFNDMLERIRALGEMRVEPARTGVVFAGRTHFAGLKVRDSGVEVTFILEHEVRHPRISKIERITPSRIAHKVILEEPAHLDYVVLDWLREAYALATKVRVRPGLRE